MLPLVADEDLPRDKYGFTPLPVGGLSFRDIALIVIGLAVFVPIALFFAITSQTESELDRLSQVLARPGETPSSYHYIAIDEQGLQYEVWFEAPGKWRTNRVADGRVNVFYNEAGAPLGQITDDEMKRQARSAESNGTSWSFKERDYLGRKAYVLGTARTPIRHELVVDAQYRFVLASITTGTSDATAGLRITSIEFDIPIPP